MDYLSRSFSECYNDVTAPAACSITRRTWHDASVATCHDSRNNYGLHLGDTRVTSTVRWPMALCKRRCPCWLPNCVYKFQDNCGILVILITVGYLLSDRKMENDGFGWYIDIIHKLGKSSKRHCTEYSPPINVIRIVVVKRMEHIISKVLSIYGHKYAYMRMYCKCTVCIL